METGFFLCFGHPKTGTTFLQRCLDLHPRISCPAEHATKLLHEALSQWAPRYNEALEMGDRRTGGQGARLLDGPTVMKMYFAMLPAIAAGAARDNEPIRGLNDNMLLRNIDRVMTHMPDTKTVAIARSPIDVALSAWRHNHRLHEAENGDGGHMEVLTAGGGTLDGWVHHIADRFSDNMTNYLKHADGHPNHLLIRYEDLSTDTEAVLWEVFSFLGAATTRAEMRDIVAASGLETMRAASAHPSFFGEGRRNSGAGELSEETRRRILDSTAPLMHRLGYDPAQMVKG